MANAKSFKTFLTLCVGVSLCFAQSLWGQQAATSGSSSVSGSGSMSSTGAPAGSSGSSSGGMQLSAQQSQQLAPYQASVPEGTATSTPISLSIEDAVNRGLRTNLGLLTNQQASRQSRAQRLQALSQLLPKLTGQVGVTAQQINLAAMGFNFTPPPGSGFTIPKIIGPYSYEAAQVNATVPIFNWSNISNYRAAKESTKASLLDVKDARELVVVAVGFGYLQIIEDAARIMATKAEIDADNAIYLNAQRRHDSGTAIGIDVLRSQVELKQRQQALVAQENQLAKDKLLLGRTIGLPLGQDFTISDPSPNVPLSGMPIDEALKQAYSNRSDYQAAKARVLAAELSLRGSKAERYPSAQAQGDYGAEGLNLFNDSHGVFTATVGVSFNIFDGGRIKSDVLQSDAQLTDARNNLANLRGQIDYDVRTALLDLKSANEQVDVAQSNVGLAKQTLQQSRDRFAAGVTNTVEVVQSQQSVADADENLISAQYQLNVAKVELARALGIAEQGVKKYFSHTHP